MRLIGLAVVLAVSLALAPFAAEAQQATRIATVVLVWDDSTSGPLPPNLREALAQRASGENSSAWNSAKVVSSRCGVCVHTPGMAALKVAGSQLSTNATLASLLCTWAVVTLAPMAHKPTNTTRPPTNSANLRMFVSSLIPNRRTSVASRPLRIEFRAFPPPLLHARRSEYLAHVDEVVTMQGFAYTVKRVKEDGSRYPGSASTASCA